MRSGGVDQFRLIEAWSQHVRTFHTNDALADMIVLSGSVEAPAWYEGNSALRQDHMLCDIPAGGWKQAIGRREQLPPRKAAYVGVSARSVRYSLSDLEPQLLDAIVEPRTEAPVIGGFRHAFGPSPGAETEKAKMMNQMWAADAAAKANGGEGADGLIGIGEMAKRHGVTHRTLRFYEDKGLLAPRREGRTRLYTRRDNSRLKLILLGRKVGFTLREVKKMIDLYDPSGSNIGQLKYALDKSEKQLARLHHQRNEIDEAIGELNVLMTAVRSMLARAQPATSA